MTKKLRIFKFSENNSGGRWWLEEEQYDKLLQAGFTYTPSEWDIKEGYDKKSFVDNKDGKIPYGWRHGLTIEAVSMQEAVEKWEAATGKDFFAEGCNCCGAPFSMTTEEPHDYMSGDSVSRTVNRPW